MVVLFTPCCTSDWEKVAPAAANLPREQLIYQVGMNQISA
jgi:hypothetical protein